MCSSTQHQRTQHETTTPTTATISLFADIEDVEQVENLNETRLYDIDVSVTDDFSQVCY